VPAVQRTGISALARALLYRPDACPDTRRTHGTGLPPALRQNPWVRRFLGNIAKLDRTMTTEREGRIRVQENTGTFIESIRMPRPVILAVLGVILAVGLVLYGLRAVIIVPVDVTPEYYATTFLVYGLWIGSILFFMLASFRGVNRFAPAVPCKRFLCLIPAYNEARVITNSVSSLLQQHYPRENVEVVVVFDGADETGDIARAAGATVVQTPQHGSGKHEALAFAIDRLIDSDDDRYVVVVDADNVVALDYLQRMNDAIIGGGYTCLQGYHAVLNPARNWVTRSLWCAVASSSRLYNQGRFNSIGNALVCGTGWCCRADLIKRYWPRLRTQTEDIELNGVLLLNEGIRVAWVPDARFYDEKPGNLWVAAQQRQRWMTGHMRLFFFLAGPCLREALRRFDVALLELALYYAVPFVLSLGVLQFFGINAAIAVGICSVSGPLANPVVCGALSITTVAILVGYQAIGFRMENGGWARGFLYGLYTIPFSIVVWTMALVSAWVSLRRSDWIYHTPHVVDDAEVAVELNSERGVMS